MSSVQVAVRVRPVNRKEVDEGLGTVLRVDDKRVAIEYVKSGGFGASSGVPRTPLSSRNSLDNVLGSPAWSQVRTKEFDFDACFTSGIGGGTQDSIYENLGTSVLKAALEGYNATLFAYGQTGSGKTYSMLGTRAEPGLVYRICRALFNQVDDGAEENEAKVEIELSCLQIYDEVVTDLLAGSGKSDVALKIREHPSNGPYVEGLSKVHVSSYSAAESLLRAGLSNRITAATSANDVSSRSHALVLLTVTRTITDSATGAVSVRRSLINLVDLAGSERAAVVSDGARLKETRSINSSLFVVSRIIKLLAEGSDGHIPYRDSVLTWLLKDSLGGTAKTIVLATVSPAASCVEETLSTLSFASNAKKIVNVAKVNDDQNITPDMVATLRNRLAELQGRVRELESTRGGNNTSMVGSPVRRATPRKTTDQATMMSPKPSPPPALPPSSIFTTTVPAVHIPRIQDTIQLVRAEPYLLNLNLDVLLAGDSAPLCAYLKRGATAIGSAPDCAINVPNLRERHCEIHFIDYGDVVLKVEGGAPVFVDGRPVENEIKLTHGAVIACGSEQLFWYKDFPLTGFNAPERAEQWWAPSRLDGIALTLAMTGAAATPRSLPAAQPAQPAKIQPGDGCINCSALRTQYQKDLAFHTREAQARLEHAVSQTRQDCELEIQQLRASLASAQATPNAANMLETIRLQQLLLTKETEHMEAMEATERTLATYQREVIAAREQFAFSERNVQRLEHELEAVMRMSVDRAEGARTWEEKARRFEQTAVSLQSQLEAASAQPIGPVDTPMTPSAIQAAAATTAELGATRDALARSQQQVAELEAFLVDQHRDLQGILAERMRTMDELSRAAEEVKAKLERDNDRLRHELREARASSAPSQIALPPDVSTLRQALADEFAAVRSTLTARITALETDLGRPAVDVFVGGNLTTIHVGDAPAGQLVAMLRERARATESEGQQGYLFLARNRAGDRTERLMGPEERPLAMKLRWEADSDSGHSFHFRTCGRLRIQTSAHSYKTLWARPNSTCIEICNELAEKLGLEAASNTFWLTYIEKVNGKDKETRLAADATPLLMLSAVALEQHNTVTVRLDQAPIATPQKARRMLPLLPIFRSNK